MASYLQHIDLELGSARQFKSVELIVKMLNVKYNVMKS